MIESQYTQAIHKKLAKHVYKWKVNDNFAGGVPDAFYRSLKKQPAKPLWVEYKFLKDLPKRDDTMIVPNLSAQQFIWLKQAFEAGEQTAVIIGVENVKYKRQSCGLVLDNPYLWEYGISTGVARNLLQGTGYDEIAHYIETIIN